MPGGNKKIGIDIGVDFKVEGNQLEQYVNRVKESINSMQNGSKNGNAFSGTEKALNDLVTQYDKLSKIKLNTDNVGDYIRQQDKLRQAIVAVNQAAKNESSDLTAKQEKYNQTITTAKQKQEELLKLIGSADENGNVKMMDGSIKSVQELTRSYNAQKGVVTRAENSLKALNGESQRQQQILSGVNAAVKQANGSLQDNAVILQKAAQAEAEANKQSLINGIKQKITYYTSLAFSIRVVRQQLRDAVKTFQDVDKSITSISMVSGISRDTLWGNIGEYNKLAQELGTTTDKVLQASQLYYQQGRNTIEVVELTRESLTLAAIAGLETADATNYLTAAVNGYKMEASEAGEVTDVWAQLAAKNAVSVKELAVSISKVASIAQSAGMDIQSTSAFLTQMIATTREAPENLGTALKTIIARFQELKTSTAALEDGVDANKVEKALKTVGISLRDTTGQFRDFDDVILELSSKWDDLDRNTQRYIATIAAGSRQQSRFIALVSDYDGLVEIMDQAANAEGAASEQFDVYSTGMEAALNRVKSAWQGFYLSWQDGHNIITGVLNSVTGLLNTMSKIGIVPTAGLAVLSTQLLKVGFGFLTAGTDAKTYFNSLKSVQLITNLVANATLKKQGALVADHIATTAESIGVKTLAKDEAILLVQQKLQSGEINKTNAARMMAIIEEQGEKVSVEALTGALQGLNTASPLGWITLLVGVLVTLIPLFSTIGDKTTKLEEQIGSLNEKASQANQNAKSAQQYADALEEAVKAGEDTVGIREQIADAIGDEINGVDVATASWKELVQALKEYGEEQTKIAAGSKYNAAVLDKNNQTKQSNRGPDLSQFDYDRETETYYTKTGEYVGNYTQALARLDEETKEVEKSTISFGAALNATKAAFGDDYSAEQINNIANAVQYFDDALLTYNEDTKEYNYDKNLLNEIIGFGDLGTKSAEQLEYIKASASAEAQGYIDTWIASLQTSKQVLNDQLTAIFADPASVSNITTQLSPELTREFAAAFDSLGENEEIQASYQDAIKTVLSAVDPSELSEGTFQAIADAVAGGQEGLMDYYNSLISIGTDGNVVISDFAATIGELLTDSNKAFVEGKKAVDDYNQGLRDLDDLTSASSLDDYAQKIWNLSLDYETLGYATQDELLTELWANTVRDESGNYIIQEGSLLASLRDEYDLNNAAARNNAITTLQAEIAKMTSLRNGLQAHYDYILGTLTAYETGEDGMITYAEVTEQGVSAIMKDYSQTMSDLDADAAALGAEVLGLGGISELNNASGLARQNIVQYANRIKGYINTISSEIATATQQVGMLQAMNLASPTKSGGGGGGGSNSTKESSKETEKLSKSMEEAAKAAKELAKQMQDAAKAEIAAAKERLEYLKKQVEEAKEAREKALEASRKHNKIYFEELKGFYEDWLKNQQDAIDKAKEKEKELEDARDADNDRLNKYVNSIQDAYDLEIGGIQAKIDALDKEAEAEDRLRKIQEARDAYERSRNQRTRLVLTQGAGWIFKTDTEALNQARDGLKDAQRDYQKAVLQDEIDKLEEQKNQWAEIAENIGKTTEELAEYDKLLSEAKDLLANGDVAAAMETFRGDVIANNAKAQAVVDQENLVAKLEEQYSKDEERINTIIEQIDKILDMIDWDAEDIADEIYRQNKRAEISKTVNNDKSVDQMVNAFTKSGGFDDFAKKFLGDYTQLGSISIDDSTDLEKLFDTIGGYNLEQLYGIQQLDAKALTIEQQIENWDKLSENIGKTTEEIEAAKKLSEKYSKLTLEQLSKDSNIYNSMDKRINGTWLTGVDTTKDGWFDKVAKAIEQGKIGMVEAADYLKIYNEQIEAQKAKEEEEKNIAAAQNGSSGGSTGSAVSSNYNNGGGSGGGNGSESIFPIIPSTTSNYVSDTPETWASHSLAASRYQAIQVSTQKVIEQQQATALKNNVANSATGGVTNVFNISSNANNVKGIVADAARYANIKTQMTK